MLSALKRLRLLPPLAIWLSVSVPAPAQTLHAAARPDTTAPGQASPSASGAWHGAADQTAKPSTPRSIAEVRTADLDADGNLDLVATGRGGLQAWINVRGRFVEHSATHAILRHHTTPGFTTARRASHVEDAALSVERLALITSVAPSPFFESRSQVRPSRSSSLASRPLDAGASRAPPLSARS